MLRLIKTIFFLLFSLTIQAQEQNTSVVPTILPPSPTAYELGKYGQINVGTFTGTPNISVPLYTYKTKNLSIPISLSYNSNGILVDQMESNVGLGWSLNAGGVINRVVRGKQDEGRSISPISEDNDCYSENFITYMSNNQLLDTQPDLYSYNFQGQSGQFVFDKYNKAVLVPHNNLKIEKLDNHGFKIITDDGTEYLFYDIEYSTWENPEVPTSVATGWYLSKIIHPQGDIINFTYRETIYTYITNISRSLPVKIAEERCGDDGYRSTELTEQNTFNTLSIVGKVIESISSTEAIFGSLNFQHIYNPNLVGSFLIKGFQVNDSKQNNLENTVFNYLVPENKRIFLSECIFKDTSKRYSFEYENPQDLVERLSNSTDLWGFYNGKGGDYPDPNIHKELYRSNDLIIKQVKIKTTGDKRADQEFAKKGILKKIVYPTKGYNEFEYESNSVMGTITSPLQLEDKTIKLYNHGYGSEILTDSFEFENKVEYEAEIEATIISDGYDSGNNTFPEGDVDIAVTVENLVNPGANMTYYTTSYNQPNIKSYKFAPNTNYRITVVYTPGIQTTARVKFNYCIGGGVESIGAIPVGGLRIKEERTFDTELNRSDIKHYYYGTKDNLNVSSGVEGIKMNLITDDVIKRLCYGGILPPGFPFLVTTRIFTVHSNSIYQFYKSNGNSSTTYKNVTISHGGSNFENGGEELYYSTSSDIKPVACLGNSLLSAPWTNASWDNGLLLKKTIFNDKLITLNEIVYNYKLEDQYTKQVTGIAYDFKYNPIYGYSMNDIRAIEHLNINKYSTNSYWFYLESEQNTQYDLNGSNPISTIITYKYNNPVHLKLSSQTTTNSTGEKIETKYFYPSDPEMIAEPFRNELIAKNMIGKVLDTQVLKKGVKLSEQKTIYNQNASTNGLLLPESIYINKGQNAIDLNIDKKITFNKYDNKGNILQYTQEGGSPVSIIWGYNKTQPIAKIDNATYVSISSDLINAIETASSGNGTEENLLIALNNLRTSLPGAMVTTYTYIPLVGVSTITDPKGNKMIYTYNSFGRLQYVKDKNLNILQKYCYNYKGQQIDCNINFASGVVYKSTARSGSFTRNNCASGEIGSSVVYSLAEGVETSTVSQADADSKGLARFNSDGQVYANTNGICTIPPPAAPTGLTFTSATATSLNFSWIAVAGAISYKIYKNGLDTGITSSTNTGSLSGLTSSTAYSIQIVAINASGISALSSVVSMSTTSAAISNSCYVNFNRLSGTCVLYKNGSSYLSRSISGTSSGTLAAGDTFYVALNATTTYYKSITITSSVRGVLYDYGPNKTGSSVTSGTFTKTGSETITIDCTTTDMLD